MPTNPVIDLRGESDSIARNLQVISMGLRQWLMSDEDKALEFAKTNPDLAEKLARAYRRPNPQGGPSIDPQIAKQYGGPKMIEHLAKLFPVTDFEVQEQRAQKAQDFAQAQTQGPQLSAFQELATPIRATVGAAASAAAGGTAPIPQLSPTEQQFGQLATAPGVTKEMAMAAAPKALEEKRRQETIATYQKSFEDTRSLITPEQALAFQAGLNILKSGGDIQVASQLFPTKIIELQKLNKQVQTEKDLIKSNRDATAWLVKYGSAPESALELEEGLPGAIQAMEDEFNRIQDDARKKQTALVGATQIKDQLVGAAMEVIQDPANAAIAANTVDLARSAKAISDIMMQDPAIAALPTGMVRVAVNEALKTIRGIERPGSETEVKLRLATASAYKAIKDLDIQEDKAKIEGRDSPGIGIYGAMSIFEPGTGGVLGSVGALAISGGKAGLAFSPLAGVGGFIGGAVLGAAAPSIIRRIGKEAMSPEEQELMLSARHVASVVYRAESGAAVKDSEIRNTIERYIPLSTDGAAVRATKREYRAILQKTLQNVSGLPDQTAIDLVEANVGLQADAAIREAQAQDANSAATQKAGELVSTLGTSGAIKALNQERAFMMKSGSRPNEQYFETVRIVKTVEKIDKQIEQLSKVPDAQPLVQELQAKRNQLAPPPVPEKKPVGAMTPDQYLAGLRNELARLNSILATVDTDEERDKVQSSIQAISTALEQFQAK